MTIQVLLFLIYSLLCASEASSGWIHCGFLSLPEGGVSVTTDTPWLHLSPAEHRRMHLHCSCHPPHEHWTATLQLTGPARSYDVSFTMISPCSMVGCRWNPPAYLIVPKGGALVQEGEVFEYAQNGFVQVRLRDALRSFGEQLNITMPIVSTANRAGSDRINLTQSLLFDVLSCVKAANVELSVSLALSLSPLFHLARHANRIHDSSVVPPLTSPSSSSMRHGEVRMLRQAVNTPPRFTALFYTEELDENNEPGVTVGTVLADDPDTGVEGQITYSFADAEDASILEMFEIDPQSGDISVNVMLDHEMTPQVSFRVQATDGAGGTGITQFRLDITDLNDNQPTFQQGSYFNETVREDTQVSTEIVEFIVIDEDSGSNGQVTYSLLNDPDHTFNIVQSGSRASLTLRENLDYETRQSYLLTILAHDEGSPVLSSSATVEIHVTDVADSLPVFNSTSYSVELSEDTPPIAYLLTVYAVSSDSLPLAGLEYFITQGDLDGRFSLDQSSGVLSLVQTLDYERTQAHLLQVQAQSVLNPTLRSTANVHVIVDNVNDHTPSFSRSQYSASVLESVIVPTHVVTVTAEDLDRGDFGEVSYLAHPDTEEDVLSTFALDSSSGVISTRSLLDKEQRDRYSFTVEAHDRGDPPLVSGVMVVIHVTDVNDEQPVFTQAEYSGLILENKSPGSEVTGVTATDSDSDASSLQYFIQSGNYGNAFQIEASDGVITNRIRLDREERSEYTLVVVASDQQFESVPALVHINVIDENDERPILHTTLYTPPPVPETTPTGTELLRVQATDRDTGSNGLISYTSLDIDPAFHLDTSSGAVTLARSLDYESGVTMYSFTVQASDGGEPQLSSTARVLIHVTDENDNPPVFEGTQFEVTLTENQPPYISVLQLSASDADSGSNSDLSYSVVGDGEALGVFGVYQSGLVYTLEPLDRERRDHYQVVVRVSDRGVEPLSDDVTISVTVDDVIDYPPFFSQLLYNVFITMETPMNFELLTVSAMTLDLESSLIYDITSGGNSLFSIDQSSGTITTVTTLDPEQDAGEYILQVTAQHSEFAGTTVVVVTVQVDTGVPLLAPLTVYLSVYESQLSDRNYIGRVLVRQQRDDLPYSFSLVNSDPCVRHFFDISETDGGLVVRRGVATGVYSINVTVTTPTGRGHGEVVAHMRVVTNATLDSAVVATFAGLREASFVSLQLELFVSFLVESLGCTREQVELLSVGSESEERVQLAFAVRDSTLLRYKGRDTIVDRLLANQHNARPSSLIGYNVDACIDEPCPNLQLCKPVIALSAHRPGTPYRTLPLGQLIFISQPFSLDHECHCLHGYNRTDLCASEIDLCDPSPCDFGGVCRDNVGDYLCQCPQGTYGRNCSIVCPSFSCEPCDPDPCLYGGVCTAEQASYACNSCPWGSEFSGPNCELTSLSFELGSFTAFPQPPLSAALTLSLEFATISPNGLLLYSGRFSGRHDYISIELVIGQIRVGMSYGDLATVVRTESSWQLNNAEWHSVDVELRERELRVRVSGCGQGSLQGAEYHCELSALLHGNMRTLDLTTPLYVGGLESHVQRHEAISSTSYSGCIANVAVGGTLLDFNAPLRARGVESGCSPRTDRCSGSSCGSDQCVNVWNGTVCSCEGESPLCATTGTSIQLFPGYYELTLTLLTSLDHFSIAVRTRTSDAVLARLGMRGTLELVRGSVQFRRSQGMMLTALTLTADAYINDGLWHKVTLTHTSTHTQLAVDGERVVVRSPEGGSLPVQSVILGADEADASSSRFIGCLGKLEINTRLIVDLGAALTSSSTGYVVTHGGVAIGCGPGEPCADAQCPPHSSCVSGWRNHSCECDSDSSHRVVGGACVNPCEPNPCLNEGACVVSNSALFQCNCVSPYSGVMCESTGFGGGVCEAGFYGSSQCQPCKCDSGGVVEGVCDSVTGQCWCKTDSHYYSRAGDLGCKSCDCHTLGSVSAQCDSGTGQCDCKRHVMGRRCDACVPGFAGLDENGCKAATFQLGTFSLARSYSGYYDDSASMIYHDLTTSVSLALEKELMTFGLPGRFEADVTGVGNSSRGVAVEYQIASYFTGDNTQLSGPSPNTIGSAVQVIVQSGWVGPHRLLRDSHSLSEVSCDSYPVMCGVCPEGTTQDGIICRPVDICSGPDQDRDGMPDDCDNCTTTFNPDQDPSVCTVREGVCQGGVASGVLWSPTPEGSADVKLCVLPSTGYVTRPCGVGGVWGEVNTLGCLSVTGQQLQEQSSSLAAGQLLSLDELTSLLTQLTAHTTAQPLSGSDVQTIGRLLSQVVPLIPGYGPEGAKSLVKNCSLVASNLLNESLLSAWRAPVEDAGFNSEDFLQNIEELFTLAGELRLSLADEHIVMSQFTGESPSNIAIGDKSVRVYVPDQLATPTTTLGAVSNLGRGLPSKFNFNTDSVNFTVATPILVVQGSEVGELATPINMTLPYHSTLIRPEGIESARCVYWEYGRGWSTSGCGLVSRNTTHAGCTCSHLTVFAVILPASSLEPLPPPPGLRHTPEIFTYIIIDLAAIVMVISFIILACLPSVRTLQTCAHMNLLVALSLAAITFLMGINRVEIAGVCVAMGVCLMFFILSSLSWLVADSLMIARFLLTPPPRTNFVIYLVIVGWMLPVFLCGIPVGTIGIVTDSFLQDLGYPDYCWLAPRVILAFIAPVIILLVLYAISIIFSFVMLSKMKKDEESTGIAMAMNKHRIRVALLVSIVTVLLVVATWTLGLLVVYVEKFLEYPFAILYVMTAIFLFLVHCCNSQVREAIKGKLSKKSNGRASLEATIDTSSRGMSTIDTSSRGMSTIENDRQLTGTYAEVELVPHHTRPRPYNHSSHITPYVTTVFEHNSFNGHASTSPSSSHTPVTAHKDVLSPKQKENDWFKIPDPIPLSPLTFSTEHEEESPHVPQPLYSQVIKPRDQKSDLTDIDHVPSPSPTELYDKGRGSGGGSPQSYLEVEPMAAHPLQAMRSEDPLWYRQRDSMSVEVDPLPYETAVQSPIRSRVRAEPANNSPRVPKQRSLSDDWLSQRRVSSNHSSASNSPASQRPQSLTSRPLPNPYSQSDHESSVTMPPKPRMSPRKLKEVRFKSSSPKKQSAGHISSLNPPHVHPHARHRLSDSIPTLPSQVSSAIPSSLQVQVGKGTKSEQYHKNGPSLAKKGQNEVIRHSDGSETVRSLV